MTQKQSSWILPHGHLWTYTEILPEFIPRKFITTKITTLTISLLMFAWGRCQGCDDAQAKGECIMQLRQDPSAQALKDKDPGKSVKLLMTIWSTPVREIVLTAALIYHEGWLTSEWVWGWPVFIRMELQLQVVLMIFIAVRWVLWNLLSCPGPAQLGYKEPNEYFAAMLTITRGTTS